MGVRKNKLYSQIPHWHLARWLLVISHPTVCLKQTRAKYASSINSWFFCFQDILIQIIKSTSCHYLVRKSYFCCLSVPFLKMSIIGSSLSRPYTQTSIRTHTHAGCVQSIKRISAQPVNHLSKRQNTFALSLEEWLQSSCPVILSDLGNKWWVNLSHLPVVVSQHQAAPPQLQATDFIQCIYLIVKQTIPVDLIWWTTSKCD